MATISHSTKKLIQQYLLWNKSLQSKEDAPTIHVDEVASTMAAFYEKIRGVVDWREEHLLRKTAIERILKRRLFFKKNGEQIAALFVQELIRGGHFPNDTVPENQIQDIQRSIDKYIFILENSPVPPRTKQKSQLHSWILGIAACEIEEILSSPIKENALIDYMTDAMQARIKVREGLFVIGGLKETTKRTQIYIAVQRALFRLDPPIISYHLLKKKFSDWSILSLPDLQEQEIAQRIYAIWTNITKELNHPLSHKFYKVCERYDTPYLLFGDILTEDPTKAQQKISQPETLENLIKESYNKRAKTLKSRISRAAVYATISIFLTNMLVLYALEIPFTLIIMGQPFGWTSRLISVLGPTLLMFFLIFTIKLPKKENLQMAIVETMKIVYQNKREDVYEIKVPPKRGIILKTIITFFYFLCFCLSYGLILWALQQFQVPIITQATSLAFISLIAFAGIKLREKSKELQIIEEKEGFFHFMGDLFSIPIVQIGKRLSCWWTKNNALALLFVSLIDMPFQLFVEFLEQWRYFLKEKREEIH